jgi:predicted nucleic acid-binding protein
MTAWLIDKSALVRLSSSADAQDWADRIARGLVRITTMTLLEVGFSARSGPDLRAAAGAAAAVADTRRISHPGG